LPSQNEEQYMTLSLACVLEELLTVVILSQVGRIVALTL
jgi:hypothetical protein